MNSKIDRYISKNKKWQKELKKLRTIILECNLIEELKWGVPCYTSENSNILLIHCFKEYCAILFHQGALLKDIKKILIQQTKNVQAARQIRFTDVQEIEKIESVIKMYIKEAVKNNKAGLKVNMKKTEDFEVPEEFKMRLDEDSELRVSFEALTPGRQRGYLLHFSSAKQSKTRESRIDKCIPLILNGIGLNDR
ncbi:MAG: hypothetical protein DWP97_09930 [Calditrichaeota bacterium]|nr:MAG: hypothetical protein DWP97_09930 [Calditrichota bacterium]